VIGLAESGLCFRGGLFVSTMHKPLERKTLKRAQSVMDSVRRRLSPEQTLSVECTDTNGNLTCVCAAMWSGDLVSRLCRVLSALRYFEPMGIQVTGRSHNGRTAVQWTIPISE